MLYLILGLIKKVNVTKPKNINEENLKNVLKENIEKMPIDIF